jgi:hypothetical protein
MKTIRNIVGLLIGGFLLLSIQSCVLVERDYPTTHRIVILKSRAPYYYEHKYYRPYTPPPGKWKPYHNPPGQTKPYHDNKGNPHKGGKHH